MEKQDKAFEPDNSFNAYQKNWIASEDFAIRSITDAEVMSKVIKYVHRAYKEDEIEYEIRVKNTEIPSDYEKSLEETIGKIFDSSDTVKTTDVHPKIQIYLDNIDSRGNSLASIGKQILKNLLIYGDGGGIVDFSTESKEDFDGNKPYKGRPYFINMRSIDVIGIVTRQIDGAENIAQVRFYTQEIESDLEFEEIEVEKVRVYSLLDNGGVELTIYTKKDNEISSNSLIMKSIIGDINKIPICTASNNRGGNTKPFRNNPPLSPLLRGCIELSRKQSNDNNTVSIATTPMLVDERSDGNIEVLQQLSSYDDQGNLICDANSDNSRSPNKVYVKEPGERMYYVNTGDFQAAMDASKNRIDDLKITLKSLGVSSLLEQTARETVVKTITNNSTSQSQLSAIAVEVENCLNDILKMFGMYIGVDEDEVGTVTINMDFGSLDKSSLKSKESIEQLQWSYKEGLIDDVFMLNELSERGCFSKLLTEDKINALLGNAEAKQSIA